MWPGLFPQAPAQPGLSARGADCANSGITEIGASSCLLYTETQRWHCGLLICFFLPMHLRRWRGLEEDLGLLSTCQGIFPDNSRLCWYFGVRRGSSVQVIAWVPGLLPHQFADSQWVDTELVPELSSCVPQDAGRWGDTAPLKLSCSTVYLQFLETNLDLLSSPTVKFQYSFKKQFFF